MTEALVIERKKLALSEPLDNKLLKAAKKACIDVLPGWKAIPTKFLETKRITGGLTNILTKVFVRPAYVPQLPPGTLHQALVRTFGKDTEVFFSRNMESLIFASLSSSGVGPKLLGTFPGGRIEEFLDADTLQTTDCKLYIPQISEVLAGVHDLDIPEISHEPNLFKTLTSWLDIASKVSFPPNNPKAQLLSQIDFKQITQELQSLQSHASSVSSPVVFCHNDLLAANLMRSASGVFHVIDFEYGNYNFRGYDIANHFSEWVVDYSLETHPKFKICTEYYPSAEQKELFALHYLRKWYELKGNKKEVSPEEVKQLIKEVDYFLMIPHLVWSLWAIIQSGTSTISFGYLEFALQRLEQYYQLKQMVYHKYGLFHAHKEESLLFLTQRSQRYAADLESLQKELQEVRKAKNQLTAEKQLLLSQLQQQAHTTQNK